MTLTSNSPCIDTTDDTTVYTDFNGTITPYGSCNDIGAIECMGGAAKEAKEPVVRFVDVNLVTISPNPFTSTTRLLIHVPEQGGSLVMSTLKVYNVKGRLVRTLLEKPMAAGYSMNISWNGKDDDGIKVVPGMYLYEFTAGTKVEKGSMVLMK